MYPSFQRFRDASDQQQSAQARAGLHAPGGLDDGEEDARDVVRSLQPLPSSARLMSASAMMRELQTRVAPQYLPSPAQQQQIQQYQLQQQQQQMNMQQQQQMQQQMQQVAQRRARGGRSGSGAPAPQQQVQVAQLHQIQQAPPPQPVQYFNVDNASGTWGQMGDGLNNNITPMSGFSVGGGDMPVYDINGNGAGAVPGNSGAARASLNAQFLPSIHSKYRRENDVGVQEVQEEEPEMQQQQQPQEPEDDEQSERERIFRMRSLYLQQQHAMERQKLEERQQLQRQQQEERRQLVLQQQQLQQQRRQQQQQPQYQQSQQQLQQQQMQMQQMQQLQQQAQVQQSQHQGTPRERRDLAPLATTTSAREPDYDLPRRIHRELQPPSSSAISQSATGATTFAPQKMPAQPPAAAARRNVNNANANAPSSVASTASGGSGNGGNGGGLSLPLPPPLPSTARRFASQLSPHGAGMGAGANVNVNTAAAAAEFASLQQPPSHAPIAPVVPVAQPKASGKASKVPQQVQIPRQQVHQVRVQPRPPTAAQRLPVSAELRNDVSMYYRDVQQVPPPPPQQQQHQQHRQQIQQQQQDVACCFPTDTPVSVKNRPPARRRTANEYDDNDDDDDDDDDDDESDVAPEPAPKRRKPAAKRKSTKSTKASAAPRSQTQAVSTGTGGSESTAAGAAGETKRRCGRKSMNYSSEQKRERNRAAVKKCRQRQALKYEFLLQKAEVLETENRTLSDMLVNNVDLKEEKRTQLTRGIQMDILFKIKEIFTQSLPKDFVLDADSIWDLNSVLAVSMPSRCYYGIESIKEFWRTSLRMRNKGKIRSFWAWLFRLPPGDRFTEFDIQPFSETSNLYFITWTTKSEPPLSGSMVIMFGHGHRVTLHVECFGWLIWRYLLTNEPFPEPTD